MATVTVVVPTYNRADLLGRAVESVLDQTHRDLELVVVDDGSTDETESVVTGYDDERVRYVAHETNRGANVARNTGLEAATGEYVAFLDSDDEWRSDKLERQIRRVESGDWVGAYCGFETRTEGTGARFRLAAASALARLDGEVTREGQTGLADAILADDVHPGAGSTLLVRTDVARDAGGFDEDLDRFQDPEFVLRVLDVGALAYVDAPLVVRHPTGSPPADLVRAADEQYLEKHADAVARAESRGNDVHGAHELVRAKAYFAEGRLLTATRHLHRASVPPRHAPGLLWTAAVGARRRRGTRAAFGAVAAVVLVAVLLRARR